MTDQPITAAARVADVIHEARSRTGLEDFGIDTWQTGLEVLVDSALSHSKFNDLGEYLFREALVRPLTNRLRIEDWYRRHPEIDEQQVLIDFIGVGFPRTGSTALSQLVGLDPAFRNLRRWEEPNPCPPPGLCADDDEARIAYAQTEMELLDNALTPAIRAMLPTSATGPTEDHDLMELTFTAQTFLVAAQVPEYAEWFLAQDMEATYRYEERALKLLQWKTPEKVWRIKNPAHTLFLEYFERVFPTARFVQTHRNVDKLLASVADLYLTFLSAGIPDVDPIYVGELNLAQWAIALDRMLEFRNDSARNNKFFDIGFDAFQSDQIGEIRRMYAWLGQELTAETVARMQHWQRDNSIDKHGRHISNGAQFGFDKNVLDGRFQKYRERFAPFLTPSA